jgi:hypothetical protein
VTRIVRLEVTTEYAIKTLDLMQRRMDDGFKQQHADINQLRKEMTANFHWLLGIQITTAPSGHGHAGANGEFFLKRRRTQHARVDPPTRRKDRDHDRCVTRPAA